MPHVDDSFDHGLPTSPPREQAPIPKSTPKQEVKPFMGLLEELSVMEYKPDQRLVDEALGLRDAESSNGRSQLPNFEQPKF